MGEDGVEGSPSQQLPGRRPTEPVLVHGWHLPHSSPPRSGRRRVFWIAVSAVVLVVAGIGAWQASTRSNSIDSSTLVGPSGREAPQFSLPLLTNPGEQLNLGSLRGKAVVVNFWASWCTPCRAEMPLLQASYSAHHGSVAFVGVDVNDTGSAAQAFLAQVHVSYPVVSDPHGLLVNGYGLEGLPTTEFISPSGVLLGHHLGEFRALTLRQALEEAFPPARSSANP